MMYGGSVLRELMTLLRAADASYRSQGHVRDRCKQREAVLLLPARRGLVALGLHCSGVAGLWLEDTWDLRLSGR